MTSLSLFTFMHWRRKWQPTPVFLPGESQGWRSLVGCRLWGRTAVGLKRLSSSSKNILAPNLFSESPKEGNRAFCHVQKEVSNKNGPDSAVKGRHKSLTFGHPSIPVQCSHDWRGGWLAMSEQSRQLLQCIQFSCPPHRGRPEALLD